jgi:hypothetical protein
MKTYQIFMTKIYEVRVKAESRDHAEELFDEFADWDEFLKVHNLDIEVCDGYVLEDEPDAE